MELVALGILLLTLVLALARPTIGGLRFEHGSAATLGAGLMLLTGLVPWDLALNSLSLLSYPLLTIISLMIITIIAEKAGLLIWITRSVLRAGRGSGVRLFSLIFFTGAGLGMVFTNDAAILIFTPLVYTMVEEISDESWTLTQKLPFYFAVLYVGNLAGAFVISNPINIIVTSFFEISFLDYAVWMFLPAVASIVISYTGLRIAFRGSIPQHYRIPENHAKPGTASPMALVSAGVLAITLAGFFLHGLTGVPIAVVAAAGALILLALHRAGGERVGPVVQQVGWDVIVFVIGIFLVAMGTRNAGLTHLLGDMIQSLGGFIGDDSLLLSTSLISALCSSLINNHPTAGLMIWVVQDFDFQQLQTNLMVYAALIGGDLGPKMLPIGSLAALMWFRILRARGVEVSYWLYVKIGVPVTLAAILMAVGVLHLEMWLAGVSMADTP